MIIVTDEFGLGKWRMAVSFCVTPEVLQAAIVGSPATGQPSK
jgi:hypothetical protein